MTEHLPHLWECVGLGDGDAAASLLLYWRRAGLLWCAAAPDPLYQDFARSDRCEPRTLRPVWTEFEVGLLRFDEVGLCEATCEDWWSLDSLTADLCPPPLRGL